MIEQNGWSHSSRIYRGDKFVEVPMMVINNLTNDDLDYMFKLKYGKEVE